MLICGTDFVPTRIPCFSLFTLNEVGLGTRLGRCNPRIVIHFDLVYYYNNYSWMRREAQFVFMIAMRIFSILVLQKPFKKRLTTCHEFACYLTDSNVIHFTVFESFH